MYKAAIVCNYKSICLGSYDQEVDAAIAYDLAALKYFGRDLAILNFPDSDYQGASLENWRNLKAIKHRAGTWAVSKKKVKNSLKPVKPLTISDMARNVNMSRARFHQLLAEGCFPPPSRNKKGRPFYSLEQQSKVHETIKTGIGHNGEMYFFYPKKPKTA